MSWFGQFEVHSPPSSFTGMPNTQQRRLIDALLRSPTFTRSVQKVHSKVHKIQHGSTPDYPHPGGTHLEDQVAREGGGLTKFFKMFWEELRTGHKPEPKSKK